MTDYTGISNDDLLALLERKGRALECYEHADGQAWYDERQQRERTKREYTALCAEWNRRNQTTKGE
jgi:hypothetical protein